MPYIPIDARLDLDAQRRGAQTSGELNYKITRELLMYLTTHGLSYKTINDIIGALECAKLEFYRIKAVAYEEEKRQLNGDVYASL